VVFQVWADGTKLYDSGAMYYYSFTQSINVSVVGVNELRIVVTDAGDGINSDHADWAGAKLVKRLSIGTDGPFFSTVNSEIGKHYNLVLTASNTQNLSLRTFVVEYDPGELDLKDMCAYTSTKELATGAISGTNLYIIQCDTVNGKIKFTYDKAIESGKSWSGTVNIIKFEGKVTGQSVVVYSIE